MLPLLLTFALAAAAFLAAPAKAQPATSTTTPPVNFFTNEIPEAPFLNQLATWATSFNTNYTWSNGFQIDTGVATITGGTISDRINLLDDIGSFEAGARGSFLGAGSSFNELEAVGGYALVKTYDFKFCLEVAGGYDFNKANSHGKKTGAIVGEPGLAAYKLITKVTYATISYGFPVESVGKFNSTGVFYVGGGFTF